MTTPVATRPAAPEPSAAHRTNDAATLAREYVEKAIKTIAGVMDDASATAATRMAAAEAMLNRACGRPATAPTVIPQDDFADIIAAVDASFAAEGRADSPAQAVAESATSVRG